MVHLLLLEYWQQEYEGNYRHWRSELIAFRDDINNVLKVLSPNPRQPGDELTELKAYVL